MKVWIVKRLSGIDYYGGVEGEIDLYAANTRTEVYNMVHNLPIHTPFKLNDLPEGHIFKKLKPKRLEESDYGFEKRKLEWEKKEKEHLENYLDMRKHMFEDFTYEASFESNVDTPQILNTITLEE